ncbi:aminopeptidase P family protein [Sphaerothrix gracilis]|uniref:aminopeptidase P family protein n=1 Tax=Sphaerothrix gracilis TaxID=3151835 RepID=UPI0031FDAEA6
MQTSTVSSLATALRQRWQRLAQQISAPVLIHSGQPQARNFPANTYPFRASSHFLYFAGLPLPHAAICLENGKLTLFIDEASPESALWHGPTPTREAIAQEIGADAAYPLSELTQRTGSANQLAAPTENPELAAAIVQLRLIHDHWAIAEMRQAAAVSVKAHQAGMAATPTAKTEAEVRAAIEQVIMAHQMTCAYNSIVTTHGQVLHNEQYHHVLEAGDLLLADVGAEAASGWASDITRTWPVSGKFSATQRDIYDIVLAAHDACIAQAQPGVEYRHLHLIACYRIAEGLVDLGILRGQPESLVEQDAHALFFPHGVGHLIGLDVHDMEDLGDLAGYAPGRQRSDRFGLCFLRLDRPLQAGMAVTIEPGFYQVPDILNSPQRRAKYQSVINWERLAQFEDVRGIRIEDDILITANGCEVLTADLPTQPAVIEHWVSK